LILSLTLSPAAAALLLHAKHGPRDRSGDPLWRQKMGVAVDAFNNGFDRMSAGYGRLTRWLVARPKKMLMTYAGLIVATGALFWVTPAGFIPSQDQGYFLAVVQLPSGASLERTDKVTREVAEKILPIKGLRGAVMFAGFHGRRRRHPIRPPSISHSKPSPSARRKASPMPASWTRPTRRWPAMTRPASCSCRRP
jgi:multidrug efflux pump subunit AcrB